MYMGHFGEKRWDKSGWRLNNNTSRVLKRATVKKFITKLHEGIYEPVKILWIKAIIKEL